MTISSSTRKAGPFNCNGSVTSYPFTFKCFTTSDVRVVLTNSSAVESDLVLDSNYTITLNADQNSSPGGTVDTLVAYATGNTITIVSSVDMLQSTDIQNLGGFYPEVIENAFDKVTMLIQQLSEEISRAVKVDVSSSLDPSDYLTQAQAYAASAALSAAAASLSEANATADEALAEKWASEAVDVEVTSGKYSAYHWAQKAASIVGGDFAAKGANNDITGLLGITGAINTARSTVAVNATTTPLWTSTNGNIQDWTGTATITAFPDAPKAGAQRIVYPAAGTVITDNATIDVQGNANYTVVAGDELVITAITTTTFYVSIKRKDGKAVSESDYLFKSGGALTGLLTLNDGTDIASASTVDLTAATGNVVTITGTTAITAFTMTAGQQMVLIANGALPLTYHATTMNINGGGSYTCAAGDRLFVVKDTAGVIRVNVIKQDGTALVSASSGGMTLLGTLTTTSGTTQTLSGLSLTNYVKLYISINGLSFNAATITPTLGGVAISGSTGAGGSSGTQSGFIELDLDTGTFISVLSGTVGSSGVGVFSGDTSYSTASTSIQFAGGTFDAGSIKVYGVK